MKLIKAPDWIEWTASGLNQPKTYDTVKAKMGLLGYQVCRETNSVDGTIRAIFRKGRFRALQLQAACTGPMSIKSKSEKCCWEAQIK